MNKLILDSGLAQGGTKNEPTFRFLQGIDMTGIRLNTMVLPLSFNNVDSTNNTVVFSDNNVSHTATLPAGQHSGATLADALAATMSSSGTQTYTVTFDVPSMRLHITAPGQFKFLSSGTTAASVLGLKTDTTPSTNLIMPNPVDLTGTQLILLSIPQVTTDSVIYSGRESLNVLEAIPITSDLGTVEVYHNETSLFIDTLDQTISEMTIRLIDSNTLQPIDLQGQSFQVIFDVLDE